MMAAADVEEVSKINQLFTDIDNSDLIKQLELQLQDVSI